MAEQLKRDVLAAFKKRGTNFAKWCAENGLTRQYAESVLLGKRDSSRAKFMRQQIVDAAFHGVPFEAFPAGIRHTTELYIYSDKAGIGHRLVLRGIEPFKLEFSRHLENMLLQFADAETLLAIKGEADDWRPMTDSEITAWEQANA